MCVPAVPKAVAALVLENVLFAEDFCFGDILDVAFNGKRIVDGAEGVYKHVELARCELRRNIVGKTGPEKRQMALVVDFEFCGRNVYFREKIHAVNLNRI